MRVALWIALGCLVYTFMGYPALLRVATFFRSSARQDEHGDLTDLPLVTVIVPVHNEERVIGRRVRNLLELDYPPGCMQVIVASDGSTDSTVSTLRQEFGAEVLVLEYPVNRGRSAVLNDALQHARGELVVFTDADTLFKSDFLRKAVRRFSSRVGVVVGRLVYRPPSGDSIAMSEGLYWRYELAVRRMESALGILAVGTGACLVARRKLLKPLPLNYDVDDALPLDCIKQGYRVVFEPEAVAYDEPPAGLRAEIATRVRMTSRSFAGLFRRWKLGDAIRHPLITLALLSHRVLRYLSPYFMVVALLTNIVLFTEGTAYMLTGLAQVLFYSVGLLGYAAHVLGKRLPLASAVFSFCVANIGIMGGVVLALAGKAPSRYRTPEAVAREGTNSNR